MPTLNKLNPGPFVEIHPDDAKAAGIGEKDEIEVRSRRGKAVLPAAVSSRVQRGSCFVPFHWNDSWGDNLAINAVTTDACDPISKQAAFKYCAVALERVGPAQPVKQDRRREDAASAPVAAEARIAEGQGVLTATRPKLEAAAGALASAINFQPVEPPSLTEPERTYLSGFMSGLRSAEALGSTPVLPPGAPVAPATKLWLDGMLAGLYSRTGPGGPSQVPQPKRDEGAATVGVLWASQTGNSETLADAIAKKLGAAGTPAKAVSMDEYDTGRLASETRLVLVSSTYGDGDPPDNGKAFWDFLRSDAAPRLEHLEYAICALGDPSYEQFCNHGRNLDARLTELGARRLKDRIDCDPDWETQSEDWVDALPSLFGEKPNGAPPNGASAKADGAEPAGGAKEGWSKTKPFRAKLVGNVRLNGEGAGKDTRFFSFSLADSGLAYDSGDALGVWPRNCPEMVDEIVAATGLDPAQKIAVKGKGDVALGDALLHEFELTRPSREMLRLVAERSSNGDLTPLLADDRKDALKDFLWGRQLADILGEFPIRASAEEFVAGLKRMQPRLYSISSSPKAHEGEVHLTVSAVRYGERARKGACSTFLADRAKDGEVPIFIQRSSHFHLPADPDAPVIMIGPGTGVAPFRGFLHERRVTGAKGRNWLFFGEQHEATDFYYRDELLAMRDDGHLSELSLAFSRDQADKIYVQDRLAERGAEIWAWLEEGASVYVCGDASRMAKDVDGALHAIAHDHGHLDEEQAAAFVQMLAREKRYLRDVY